MTDGGSIVASNLAERRPPSLRSAAVTSLPAGFFYDVQVNRSEAAPVTLTYTVVEKPSIAEIEYRYAALKPYLRTDRP